ncbi:type II secretion system major pseudopilin GspG [bacterium]|nr:type II secretion system major pseudopilin GspG [bacterium]
MAVFKKTSKATARRAPAGFTLIEIMIVLAIVGMLFSFVGVNVIKKFRESKIQAAKIQMASYEQSLNAYYLAHSQYPDTSQGLQALISAPSSGRVPKNYPEGGYFGKKQLVNDPFGNPYRYECQDYQNYTISSDGPDGTAGTDDDITQE